VRLSIDCKDPRQCVSPSTVKTHGSASPIINNKS
jgi:hypothetical protein